LVPILVRIQVWILVPIARVPIVLIQIPRAWNEKKQEGVRKGVPLVEQSPQDGRTRGRLVSAGPVDQPVARSVDWSEAFLKSETAAWGRIEPRAPVVHLLVFLAAHKSASLHCAPGHRSFAGAFYPRLARTPAGNCGAKQRMAALVFPAAVVSSTPC
jgi:hypothetical protein